MPVWDISSGTPVEREHTVEELAEIEAERQAVPYVPSCPTPVAAGMALLTLLPVPAITTFTAVGFGYALRVASGKRVRMYFDPPQSDANYVPSVAIVDPTNANNLTARISNYTKDFVEVRTNHATLEAAGYSVTVVR